jgi:hypothetical protein
LRKVRLGFLAFRLAVRCGLIRRYELFPFDLISQMRPFGRIILVIREGWGWSLLS